MTTPGLTIPLTLEEVQKRVKCPDDGGVAIRGELIIPTDRHELFKQLLVAMQREQKLMAALEFSDATMAASKDSVLLALNRTVELQAENNRLRQDLIDYEMALTFAPAPVPREWIDQLIQRINRDRQHLRNDYPTSCGTCGKAMEDRGAADQWCGECYDKMNKT